MHALVTGKNERWRRFIWPTLLNSVKLFLNWLRSFWVYSSQPTYRDANYDGGR